MKKLFTLAAAGTLMAASLGAQAQITLDGVLNTGEIGGTGGYVLIGKFTQARGFGNAGLLSLYAATSATKITFFLGGTVEPNGKTDPTKGGPNGNAFQLFFKTPASAGVAAGTALPGGAAGSSFEKMSAKMDMPVNLAVGLHSIATVAPANSTYVIEGVSYTSATAAVTTSMGGVAGTGDASTLTGLTIPALIGARVAYKISSNGGIDMNPGNTTPNTGAAYGAAGSYGMEFEMDRAAAGLAGTATMQVFAVQNGGDGGYVSSDYIPQKTGPLPTGGTFSTTNDNLQGNPDFALVPGTQAATLNLTATAVTLPTRAADVAAIGLSVFPNPVNGPSRVAYQVTERAANVNITLTDLLGRPVRVLENSLKSVGPQSAPLDSASLAAGSYLVRVQIGDRVSTSKVSVL